MKLSIAGFNGGFKVLWGVCLRLGGGRNQWGEGERTELMVVTEKKNAHTQNSRSDNGSLLLWTWTMSTKGSDY